MKQLLKSSLYIFVLFAFASSVQAYSSKMAEKRDIQRLKKDLIEGKLGVRDTRLMEIEEEYGKPSAIDSTTRRVTYDYGEVKVVFDKRRFLREHKRDSSRPIAYTDSIDDLRFDLDSKKIVGDNVEFNIIRNTYGDPTEVHETDVDGGTSVYYYGNIRLEFENHYVLRSWKGSNFVEKKIKDVGALTLGTE